MFRVAGVGICTLAAGVFAAGCGDQEPQAADEATNRVAATIARLEQLTRRKDFRGICNGLFTADARRRAGGADCPKLLAATGRDVRAPRIELVSVTIEGDKARAKVRTSASRQAPVEDEIQLYRDRGGYRISSLTT